MIRRLHQLLNSSQKINFYSLRKVSIPTLMLTGHLVSPVSRDSVPFWHLHPRTWSCFWVTQNFSPFVTIWRQMPSISTKWSSWVSGKGDQPWCGVGLLSWSNLDNFAVLCVLVCCVHHWWACPCRIEHTLTHWAFTASQESQHTFADTRRSTRPAVAGRSTLGHTATKFEGNTTQTELYVIPTTSAPSVIVNKRLPLL